MRVFAGPNGSGKTTIIKDLRSKIPFGTYVNADDIEKTLTDYHSLNFSDFKLTPSEFDLQNFFKHSRFSPVKRNEPDLWQKLSVSNNVFTTTATIDSYLAADLASFIRQTLLSTGQSFTYETVMSHKSKIDFLSLAREADYKVYLYFIATEDPEINVNRVKVRVAQHGHPVKKETIISRYYRSLENLKDAVKQTNRSYIFDNSGTVSLLLAEITEGLDVKIFDTEKIPDWFIRYLAQ